MASHTIAQAPWAPATTVSVYPAAAQPAGVDAPSGPVVTSAVVTAAQSVTFAGLAQGIRYVAYAAGIAKRFLIPEDADALEPIRTRVEDLEGRAGTVESSVVWVVPPTGTPAADLANIQAAIDAAAANGKRVQLAAGVYTVNGGIVHKGGVEVWGAGGGGDLFYTDASFPAATGTTIRLANGTTADLWVTENFATLTGTGTPADIHVVPQQQALRYLTLDANVVGGATGWVMKGYARSLRFRSVRLIGGASGGLWVETPDGGYDMEWDADDLKILHCGGNHLHLENGHDSKWSHLTIHRDTASPASTNGVYSNPAKGGGEQFTTCHVIGAFTNASWVLGSSNADYENCTADGTGIQVLGTGNQFGGTIYGTNTPGQWIVKFGDGTTRTVSQNDIRSRAFNFKGSPAVVYTPNTTCDNNGLRGRAKMGGALRYVANGGIAILASTVASGAGTLTVDDTSFLPVSGTVYADDGTNRTSGVAYTGKTSTTLTGVTGVPAGGLTAGAGLFLASQPSTAAWEDYELLDADNGGSMGLTTRNPPLSPGSAHLTTMVYGYKGSWLEGLSVGSGGSVIKKHLTATVAWDPPSVVNGASTTTTITVTGAALGDTVTVGFTSLVTGWTITGLVTATNTVEVRITNNTGGTVDLASGSLRADVWQH